MVKKCVWNKWYVVKLSKQYGSYDVIQEKNSKYSKCKYRGLPLFEGEGRRVGCVVKDIKGKKIIYKGIKNNQKNRIRWKSKVGKKWRER